MTQDTTYVPDLLEYNQDKREMVGVAFSWPLLGSSQVKEGEGICAFWAHNFIWKEIDRPRKYWFAISVSWPANLNVALGMQLIELHWLLGRSD